MGGIGHTQCQTPMATVQGNWAFCASFSAVVDVPFIAIGLSSLVLPVRLNSLWSILFVKKGFENPKSDCEARGYLCMLPLLTLPGHKLSCGSFPRHIDETFNKRPNKVRSFSNVHLPKNTSQPNGAREDDHHPLGSTILGQLLVDEWPTSQVN